MAEGSITIDIEASTDKFDKQIINLEKKMKKEEDKKILIEADLQLKETSLSELRKKATPVKREMLQLSKEISEIETKSVVSPTEALRYNEIVDRYNELNHEMNAMIRENNVIQGQISKLSAKHKEINTTVTEYKNKIEGIRLQKHQAELTALKDNYKNIGLGVEGITKKVGKWALAIFSVRSIYNLIRQSVSTLTQNNEVLANQISSIRLALSNALAPVVQFIVNLISKAVGVIGYILKALFNIDIFAKSTASSMSSASGSVKAMKKDLAGFDEINVIGGNLAGGGIGGGLANDLRELEKIGEQTWTKLKRWFLGSDKTTFSGIMKDNFDAMIQHFKTIFEPLGNWIDKNVWQPIKKTFQETMKELEPYIEPLKKEFQKVVDDLKPYWESLKEFIINKVVKPTKDAITPIGRQIYNSFVPFLNQCIDVINVMFKVFGVHLDHLEYKTDETGKEVEGNLTTPINNVEGKINELNRQEVNIQTDTTNVDNVNTGLQGILNKLRDLVSKPWSIVTSITAKGSSSLNNFLKPLRDTLANVGIKLPFLATGGIVNMPNRGTYIGGAIAGESGREGVLPLTDSQAMAELGREIGRWITVNANIVNTMNGRVISRQLKQIENNQDFAYNT